MGKIYCTDCGAELDSTVKFCSNCGANLDNSDSDNVHDDDFINAFEVKPIIFGLVIGIVCTFLIYPLSLHELMLLVLICSGLITGFISRNNHKFVIIYGAIVGFVISAFYASLEISVHFDGMIIMTIITIISSFVGKFMSVKLNY